MLRRLSLAKVFGYAKSFKYHFHRTHNEITWQSSTTGKVTKIYGISADKPERLEGLKLSFIWVDEILQIKSPQLFLECMARVADTKGNIWVTGSLGPQYLNPKQHWAYQYFKERPLADSEVFEWGTADNPHFPKDELERLKETLDPLSFRQMFTLSWDTIGSNVVYDDFDESNVIRGYVYDPNKPTYCVIDWGWAHPMACGFFQHDIKTDTVYLFDEIVSSRLTLDKLWERIQSKGYAIKEYMDDIAGGQEREQTGRSNEGWFWDRHKIKFKHRRTAIQYGIPIVRRYIRNGMGQRRFFIDESRCPKSVDGMRNYSYQQKDGIILNENPVKKDDDCVDMVRYYFVNRHDKDVDKPRSITYDRARMF